MDNLLEVKNLDVSFYSYFGESRVLNGVNLNIKKGSIFGLVGESGSGKTMTGKAILKMIKEPGFVNNGSIIFEGNDLTKLTEEEMQRNIRGKKISMIPQGTGANLNPTFRIGTQMRAVISRHNKYNKKDALALAEQLLKEVRISDPKERLSAYAHELSGGMCQRVAIAMGLACKPQLLIADEPTTGLDVTTQGQILDLISQLIKDYGSSCMLITHDLGVIAQTCDHMAVMYAGQIVESGTTNEIFKDPLHPYTKKLMKSILRVDKDVDIYSIPGSMPNPRRLPKGCKFEERCDESCDACKEKEPENIVTKSGRVVKCIKVGDLNELC